MPICQSCNKKFQGWDSRTTFVCSPRCHGDRLIRIAKAKYEKTPKYCKQCKKVIPYEKRVGVTTCSKECARAFLSANAKKYNKDRIVWRYCLHCKKKTKNPKYCSKSCWSKAHTLPWTEERLERYRIKNLTGVRRYQTKRYQQTPNDADENLIKEFYAQCPKGYEVDHIIPISKGGFHHQDNLQYLTIHDNRVKSNKTGPVA